MPITAIYLYGSRLTAHTREWSDIDIAVFTPAADNRDIWFRIDLEVELQLELGPDVDIRIYSERDLKEGKENPASFVAHILKTGKRIA